MKELCSKCLCFTRYRHHFYPFCLKKEVKRAAHLYIGTFHNVYIQVCNRKGNQQSDGRSYNHQSIKLEVISCDLFPRELFTWGEHGRFVRVVKMECCRTGFVVLGLVLCVILNAGSEEIRVDGDDFVAFNLSSMPWLQKLKKHSLMLDFKTVHPNSLLIYIGSEEQKNDFVMLDLVRGKLRYGVYFM